MIAALRFDRQGRPRFEPATNVRLATVCTVANSVSEHVSRLLDCSVSIDIFEPVSVPFGAQPALFADASITLAHGRRSDLLVIMRHRDARRLLECAFRVERGSIDASEFSPIEEQVLERIAGEIARLCTPLCGEITSSARANGPVDGYACTTYFELRLSAPVDVVIGLGLARDPAPVSEVKLAPASLEPVRVSLTARFGKTRVPARRLATFQVGTVVAFDELLDDSAVLYAGNVPIARGQCGIRNGNHAFSITSTTRGPGS